MFSFKPKRVSDEKIINYFKSKKPKRFSSEEIINFFAEFYNEAVSVNWDYSLISGSMGKFLFERCLMNYNFLHSIFIKLGYRLGRKENDVKVDNKARKVKSLFEKIYEDGFNGGLYKEDLKNGFKKFLPKKTIERLNEKCLMGICAITEAIFQEEISPKMSDEEISFIEKQNVLVFGLFDSRGQSSLKKLSGDDLFDRNVVSIVSDFLRPKQKI